MRDQKHGSRRKGSKDRACAIRLWKRDSENPPKTAEWLLGTWTWRSSREPQPSSPLVRFRPNPLSIAPQVNSPRSVNLRNPYKMRVWRHLMKCKPIIVESPDVNNGSILGVTRPHVVRSPKQEVFFRHWVSGTFACCQQVWWCNRILRTSDSLSAPEIVRVDGTCQAEGLLHKRWSWEGKILAAGQLIVWASSQMPKGSV